MNSRFLRLTAIAAAPLFGLGLAVSGIEVALRVSGAGRVFAEADTTVGYRLTPDFVRRVPLFEVPEGSLRLATNNLGLRRDTPTAWRKEPGSTRILVLGDSQTEGIVDNRDTFSSLLEDLLQPASPAEAVEVLDAGVSGYSPLLELLAVARWDDLDPDVLLLVLYAGNDVGELAARRADFGGFGPSFAIASVRPGPGGWRTEAPGAADGTVGLLDVFLQAHFRAYAVLRRHLWAPPTPPPSAIAEVARECFGCPQALWQPWLARREPQKLEEAFAAFDRIMEQFAAIDARRPVVVAVLPTKIEVEPETVRAEVDAAAAKLELAEDPAETSASTRRRMLDIVRRHGFAPIDLQPALRRGFEAEGKALYWNTDWHLNPAGNRVVAAALVDAVRRQMRHPPSPRS